MREASGVPNDHAPVVPVASSEALRSTPLPRFPFGIMFMGYDRRQEKSLIEALRKVDAHGDVAPAHVQDPMTMVLRQRAIQADLMRWDDSRGHYVLTGTGRSRISTRSRVPGAVVRFKTRNDRDNARRTGKPIDE
jgi:hypothetical protein